MLHRRIHCLFVLLPVMLITSCASYSSWPGLTRRDPSEPPAPVVREAPPQDAAATPSNLPDKAPVLAPPTGAAQYLLEEAQRQQAAGDLAAAAASVERAMRIQPGNPWLSLRLGELRLAQGRPRQAELMAQRALTQAGQDRAFQARCWQLTATARAALGDEAGAATASARATQLGG